MKPISKYVVLQAVTGTKYIVDSHEEARRLVAHLNIRGTTCRWTFDGLETFEWPLTLEQKLQKFAHLLEAEPTGSLLEQFHYLFGSEMGNIEDIQF